jgi:DNA-binding XRE family transcriptional regulator
MPIAAHPSTEALKQARMRASEWKQFRKDFLYSQGNLARSLGCCRRTVASIESGRESIHPSVEILRRFRTLKRRHELAEHQHAVAIGRAVAGEGAVA